MHCHLYFAHAVTASSSVNARFYCHSNVCDLPNRLSTRHNDVSPRRRIRLLIIYTTAASYGSVGVCYYLSHNNHSVFAAFPVFIYFGVTLAATTNYTELRDCGPSLVSAHSRTLSLLFRIAISRNYSSQHKRNHTSRNF